MNCDLSNRTSCYHDINEALKTNRSGKLSDVTSVQLFIEQERRLLLNAFVATRREKK